MGAHFNRLTEAILTCTTMYVLGKKFEKNSHFLHLKIVIFTTIKIHSILHGHINLMILCFAHFDSESLWKHHLLQDCGTDPVSRAQIEVRPNGEVSLAKTLLGTGGDNFTVSTEEQIKCTCI